MCQIHPIREISKEIHSWDRLLEPAFSHHPNGGCRWDFWTINYCTQFFFNENYEKRLMWRAKVLLERKKVNARVNKKTQEYLHDKFSQHSAGTHKYHQISQSMLKHFHGSAELTASSKMWPSNVPGSAKTEAYSPKCPEPPKGDSMVRRQFPTCFTYCKISLWYTYTLHITMTISYKWH